MSLQVSKELIDVLEENKSSLYYDDLFEVLVNDSFIPDKFTQGYYISMLENNWGDIEDPEERVEDIIDFTRNILGLNI